MSFVDSVVVGDTAVHLFGIALPVLLLLVDNAPILLHPSSNLAIQANEQLMGVLNRLEFLYCTEFLNCRYHCDSAEL